MVLLKALNMHEMNTLNLKDDFIKLSLSRVIIGLSCNISRPDIMENISCNITNEVVLTLVFGYSSRHEHIHHIQYHNQDNPEPIRKAQL